MDKGLDYFQSRLEYEYYSKNPNILVCREWCMQKSELPCNCITGLLLSYAAYVLQFCYEVPEKSAIKIDLSFAKDILYPSVSIERSHEMQKITAIYEDEGELFLWNTKGKCNHSKETKVYYRFREYDSLDTLSTQLSDQQLDWNIRFANANYWLEFWNCFLSVLRVMEYDKANRAFMLMTILMTTEDILEIFIKCLKNEPGMVRHVSSFIDDYFDLMMKLKGISYATPFSAKFSKAFKDVTEIPIAEFIENMNARLNNRWIGEALYSQYERNTSMCRDKYSVIRELVKCLDRLDSTVDKPSYKNRLSDIIS